MNAQNSWNGGAFLARRWEGRQARGPLDSTTSTAEARGRGIPQPAAPPFGGGRLRRPGAEGGEERA